MTFSDIKFIDNSAALENPNSYILIAVDLNKVITSWKSSLFSFEWLDKAGNIRPPEQLSDDERAKHTTIIQSIANNTPLERPILGIGMLDNIEIGSRRDVLLTSYLCGLKTMDVHVKTVNQNEFAPFLTEK